jgi:hypothetical protein
VLLVMTACKVVGVCLLGFESLMTGPTHSWMTRHKHKRAVTSADRVIS